MCLGAVVGVAGCDTELPIPGGNQSSALASGTQSGQSSQSGLAGLTGQSGLTDLNGQSGSSVQLSQALNATATPGTLVIATTSSPSWPWVVGSPDQCLGFDAAIACAIAEKMGFKPDQIVWTTSTFEQAIDGSGENLWDINVQHLARTSQRETLVDFSLPYASVRKAVVTTNTNTLRFAPSITFLNSALFGVVGDSTSQSIINDIIRPKNAPLVFNTLEDTKQALEQGVVDAIVTDLPTARQIVDEIPGAFMVGQLPETVAPDQLGVSLPKGSDLTAYVSAAILHLQEDGTIDQITQRWLPNSDFIQTLKESEQAEKNPQTQNPG